MRAAWVLCGLCGLLIFLFLLNLSVGAVAIETRVIFNTLFDLEGPKQGFIINKSRLPRGLLAILTGGALALSGTVIQAILRNPLASPKIIGINSGAALAVLGLSFFAPGVDLKYLPMVAALGGISAAIVVFALAELRPMSPARLALVGIAVGFTCDAVVDFILVTADTYSIASPLVWLTGSLWSRGWPHLSLVWPSLLCLTSLTLLMCFRLDLLRLGAATATGLGMFVRLERLILLGLATLLAAISVSVVGVVGFVGLMAPHISRKLVGGRHIWLLPTAFLTGANLVLLADAAGRALWPPIEISAGILTAVFGAPFFLLLLLNSKTEAK